MHNNMVSVNPPVIVSLAGRVTTLILFLAFTAMFVLLTPVQLIGWIALKMLSKNKIDLDAVARVWVGYYTYAASVTADAVIKGVFYNTPVPGGGASEVHVIDAVATAVVYATVIAVNISALAIAILADMLMVMLCDNSFPYTEAVIDNGAVKRLKNMLHSSINNI